MNTNSRQKKIASAVVLTWRDEIDLITRPLALCAGALLAASLAVGAVGWLKRQHVEGLAQAQQIRHAASARFANVETEKQEVALYQSGFMALQAAGLVGDENRLNWIESVGQIQRKRRLVSAAYEIEPQQTVRMSGAMTLGEYSLRASRMRLQLGLVHELDLFGLIDDLRSAGPFSVQDCALKRTDIPPEASGAARLVANCTLVWLTLGTAAQPVAAPVMAEGP